MELLIFNDNIVEFEYKKRVIEHFSLFLILACMKTEMIVQQDVNILALHMEDFLLLKT